MSVATIVLTKNEEFRIGDCLKRLRPYVDYILVLDDSNDRTVNFAKPHADKILVKPFSGSFAEERNHAESHIPPDYEWILHVDADEVFDEEFLRKMRGMVSNSEFDAYRFPRINMPDRKDWPDWQVRLLRRGKAVWKRKLHEVPYALSEDRPIDQVSCETLDLYPIIHLERRKNQKRPWW